MTSHEAAWKFHRPLAELQRDKVCGCVDVSRPELGVHDVEVDARRLAGRFFCVRPDDDSADRSSRKVEPSWPLAVADAYVRGDDLVATYSPTDEWPYSPAIYWRAESFQEPRGIIASLSLLISVQTHLLDSWPRIAIGSQLACSEVLHVVPGDGKATRSEPLAANESLQPAYNACCVLRRLADVPISIAEIMPATDFLALRVRRNAEAVCHVEWELFGEFLEKGVVRRARVEAVFLPRENDIQLTAECCKLIERRPLPLTT